MANWNFILKMAWRDSRRDRRRLFISSASIIFGIGALQEGRGVELVVGGLVRHDGYRRVQARPLLVSWIWAVGSARSAKAVSVVE